MQGMPTMDNRMHLRQIFKYSWIASFATQTPTTPVSPYAVNGVDNDGGSVYSSESTGDDRLDPGLRTRPDNVSVRDDEDYSRRVLGVRNMPDGVSLASRES